MGTLHHLPRNPHTVTYTTKGADKHPSQKFAWICSCGAESPLLTERGLRDRTASEHVDQMQGVKAHDGT